ncbi:hypothetical protein [Bacillus thuringiensis]|uniref:Uncharacterized protein n=1 Tax=Bacillus wiedmannii TaxID=1890302 RepID=A0A0G8C0R7_9BACI|nr:hypothetical protein [Bacillus thuringiensis]KKZ93467.1 hypothetical protein B4147_2703 [Bacillus wiedmannii]
MSQLLRTLWKHYGGRMHLYQYTKTEKTNNFQGIIVKDKVKHQ